jgi:hypothetical protein
MDNFYTNITLRGVQSSSAADALQRLHRRAYVAPVQADCVTIFDARTELQDPNELGALASTLSERLVCFALAALNHDDTILALALYDHGRLITEYSSDAPAGTDTGALCRAFDAGAPWSRLLLAGLLRGPRPVFEITRHELIARVLGLPPWVAGGGCNYIAQDQAPDGLDLAGVTVVGGERA